MRPGCPLAIVRQVLRQEFPDDVIRKEEKADREKRERERQEERAERERKRREERAERERKRREERAERERDRRPRYDVHVRCKDINRLLTSASLYFVCWSACDCPMS